MDDDGRQKRGGGRSSRSTGRRSLAPARPNVLSNAAVPNQLSTQTRRPAQVLAGRSATATRMPASAADQASQFERSGRPLPSVSTLIFLGFVGFTIFRCATRT